MSLGIPDHVVAYAAALHHCRFGTWAQIAAAINALGMGGLNDVRYDELAKAADRWTRSYVDPAALRTIRRRFGRKEPSP
jgi:hypothetical protein